MLKNFAKISKKANFNLDILVVFPLTLIMRKNLLVIFSLLILGFNPGLAFATETTVTTQNTVEPTVTTAPHVQNEVAATAETTAEPTEKIKKPTVTPLKEEKKILKTELKDKITQARENFKTKLAELKDEHKKTVTTNIDSKITTINSNRTTEMLKHLDKLTGVLTRISSKAAALKSQGKNTTSVDAAIASAQAAIDAAKSAITTQAAKTYTIQFTSDTNVGQGVRVVMKQFRTDLKATFDKVISAQKAVSAVYKLLAKLVGDVVAPSLSPSPTATASPTP